MTTFPTIHLNGTGKQDLLDGYIAAFLAVDAAVDALTRVEFNARDYYVQGPDAYTAARAERRAQFAALGNVGAELREIAASISDQGK